MKVLKLDETQAFFDKSNKKLTLAKTAYSMEDYSDAVSLSYYAMFLVAKAFILKKGIKSPKTHAGLIHYLTHIMLRKMIFPMKNINI